MTPKEINYVKSERREREEEQAITKKLQKISREEIKRGITW
jgi:hypothetical protein